MMLKQSSSKRLRTGRGYNVKHVTQLCLVLALTFWMVYQLKHCYFKKTELHKTVGSEKVVAKLGRKWLLPGAVVEEESDESKGVEEGRADEFEQVDDMLEDIDEQDTDDKEHPNQNEDAVTERIKQDE